MDVAIKYIIMTYYDKLNYCMQGYQCQPVISATWFKRKLL